MYPYLAGDRVAVRIWAMIPKNREASGSISSDPSKVPHEHLLIGDYILGKEGDSLQVADLKKVGLPVLTAKVVMAPFSTDSPADPCCCTNDGLTCCGRTFVLMCATCPCPVCGNLKSPKPLTTRQPLLAEPTKPEAAAKKETIADKKQ